MSDKKYIPEINSFYDDITTPSDNNRPISMTDYDNVVTSPDVAVVSEDVPSDMVSEKRGSFLKDKRMRIVAGIFMILVATFLFASTVSYFFTGVDDMSEVDGATLEQLVQTTGAEINNVGGPAGALISHRMVGLGLGIGVIPVLVYLVIIGVVLLGLKKCNFWSLTFKTLLLAVTISIVTGLLFFGADQVIPVGGYHGYYINHLIIERFSWLGAVCVSLALIGALAGVYFYDLAKLWNKWREKIRIRNERLRREEEDRRIVLENADELLENREISDADLVAPERVAPSIIYENVSDDSVEEVFHSTSEADNTSEDNTNYDGIIAPTDNDRVIDPPGKGTDDSDEESLQKNIDNKKVSEDPEKSGIEETGKNDDALDEDSEPELIIETTKEIEKAKQKTITVYDPLSQIPGYKMPSIDLLEERPVKSENVDIDEIEDKKSQIIEALNRYNIGISDIKATVGPTVTMYEIVPAEGVKIATIKRLEEDIAMALAALSTRIIAPIPGKSAIGIEVPNREPRSVDVRTIFGSKDFRDCNYELPIALGATIDNQVYIADLTKMPHLLVAGATGKGKSVGMNVIINSLLFKKHPSELKLVLIDPKMVEFYPYRKLLNHYLAQVPDAENAIITETSKVVDTLNSLCEEMDDRYRLLQKAEVVKITHYNNLYAQNKLDVAYGHRHLPYIVVIIDEYADLLMTAGKEIETPIARLAQKARAVGIHVIIATQRPSSNIITGVIKGNFPARIAFKVTSYVDSNIILNNSGAFQLIGNGDMLISQDGELKRVQCAFISTEEIKNVAAHIENQPGFGGPFILPDPPSSSGDKSASGGGGGSIAGDEDPLLEEIARALVSSGNASTSNVQRTYQVGFNRAGRIMDQLHALGIVGPPQGSKPRDILVDSYRLEEILQNRKEK